MSVEVKLEGVDKLIRMLAKSGAEIVPSIGMAMHEEAQIMFDKSQEECPIETGALINSGRVEPPSASNSTITVELMYGGTAAPYAVYVHENPEARHDAGKKHRFLADPVEAGAKDFYDHVAERVERIIKDAS